MLQIFKTFSVKISIKELKLYFKAKFYLEKIIFLASAIKKVLPEYQLTPTHVISPLFDLAGFKVVYFSSLLD